MLDSQPTAGINPDHYDKLYYAEAQKIWAGKADQQNREQIERRFSDVWDRLHDMERLLQAAFRHIEELEAGNHQKKGE